MKSRGRDEGGTRNGIPNPQEIEHVPDAHKTQDFPQTTGHVMGTDSPGEVWVEKPAQRKEKHNNVGPYRLLGPDTRARFQAERQALSLMDHPNIAKVLDVGATEDARPYFVMELVRGLEITEFCKQKNLELRIRLELFTQACRAIQHAHQKGIIHRDIKPSNVLVSEDEGKPVVKVIDFGLAKSTNDALRLTDQTVYTQFGQMLGTLQYMSPEQAGRNPLDVDTRSDVYSLGVSLYELLSGSPPMDRQFIRERSLGEVLTAIRTQDAPRPSLRLSGCNKTWAGKSEAGRSADGVETNGSATDENRSHSLGPKVLDDKRRMGRLLRGELDW